MERLTMSSDGNGCMSVTLPDGSRKQLVAKLYSLHEEICAAVELGVPLEAAIRVCTENPARANGLFPKKGCLRPGSDGDLLILGGDRAIDTVLAKGRTMVRHGRALVKGTFEE